MQFKLFGTNIQIGKSAHVETQVAEVIEETRSMSAPNVPTKVWVERDDDPNGFEYSAQEPAIIDRFYDLLNGYYGAQNYIELFYCLPEVFAPIHEIASRVADANWQLTKDWNDEIDYSNEQFNRLFSEPNPLMSSKQMIYQAVCYEVLTGRQFFFLNKPATLPEEFNSIITWGNLPAPQVIADMKRGVDAYSATEISDFINKYTVPNENGGNRVFDAKNVFPVIHFSLDKPHDFNCSNALIRGAEKPIKNLIPVYEARGVIYVKRGAMGFVVSAKTDADGTQSLSPKEKKEIRREYNNNMGITGSKDPIGVSSAPVEFVRTSMSIEELQPFDETLADAVAIYAVLRVPRHLVPSKDTSTYANAAADMKSFYGNVVQQIANRYAQIFTNGLGVKALRRSIKANFDHVPELQENQKEAADVDKTKTETVISKYEKGIITKNERQAELGYKSLAGGDVYANDPSNQTAMVERLGVGGLTALTAMLSNNTISEDAKKVILVKVFGINEADAAAMVVAKPEPKPGEPGGPPDPNAPKPFNK